MWHLIKDLNETRESARQMFRGRVFQAEGTVNSGPWGSIELGSNNVQGTAGGPLRLEKNKQGGELQKWTQGSDGEQVKSLVGHGKDFGF